MPLTGTGTVLGDAVVAAIKARNSNVDATQEAILKDYWRDIATEIVNHIVANSLLSSTGATAVGPPGGPLPITALPGVVT